MEEILHQLIGSLSHYLQGYVYPRWCRISSINSINHNNPLIRPSRWWQLNNFFNCSPRSLGFHDPIWLPHIFSKGLKVETTNSPYFLGTGGWHYGRSRSLRFPHVAQGTINHGVLSDLLSADGNNLDIMDLTVAWVSQFEKFPQLKLT